MGFTIFSTSGTAARMKEEGVPVHRLSKLAEGRPNVLDMIKNGEIAMVINRPSGRVPRRDEVRIRSGALANRVPIITTMRAARACVGAIRSQKAAELGVMPLQEFHGL
jgi:carbamoyl-phosphate synthase large subunit